MEICARYAGVSMSSYRHIPAHGGAIMDDERRIIVYYDDTISGLVVRCVRDEDITAAWAEHDIIVQAPLQHIRNIIDYALARLAS